MSSKYFAMEASVGSCGCTKCFSCWEYSCGLVLVLNSTLPLLGMGFEILGVGSIWSECPSQEFFLSKSPIVFPSCLSVVVFLSSFFVFFFICCHLYPLFLHSDSFLCLCHPIMLMRVWSSPGFRLTKWEIFLIPRIGRIPRS